MLSRNRSLTMLRLFLGYMFIWYGSLKIYNMSTAIHLFRSIMPYLSSMTILFFAVIDIIVGILLLGKRTGKFGARLMIVMLTIGTIQMVNAQGFFRLFPFTSLQGELVVKNLALIAAGFAIITEKSESNESSFVKHRKEIDVLVASESIHPNEQDKEMKSNDPDVVT